MDVLSPSDFPVQTFSKRQVRCVSWCMFSVDFRATLCNILPEQTILYLSYFKCFMRILAIYCDIMQFAENRTQNPPRATSWGFDPPSRHQYLNLLESFGSLNYRLPVRGLEGGRFVGNRARSGLVRFLR